MGIIKEFKEFAIKGNAVDMAVGIILGGAFGAVVTSLVKDVMMPPMGVIAGGLDFSKQGFTIRAAEADKPATILTYGMFINALINFLIVAFALFLLVKGMNALKRKEAAAPSVPPAPTKDQVLLTEIRDLLRAGR